MGSILTMLIEQAKIVLAMREEGIKNGTRKAGCPTWDALSQEFFEKVISGEIGEDIAHQEQMKIMEHCKNCRHPMCISAVFGDVEPTVVGE